MVHLTGHFFSHILISFLCLRVATSVDPDLPDGMIFEDPGCYDILESDKGSRTNFAAARIIDSAIGMAREARNKLNLGVFPTAGLLEWTLGKRVEQRKPLAIFKKIASDVPQGNTGAPIRIWCTGNRFQWNNLVVKEDKDKVERKYVKNGARGDQLLEYDDDDRLLSKRCFEPTQDGSRVVAFVTKAGDTDDDRFHDIQICPWVWNVIKDDPNLEGIYKITDWSALSRFKRDAAPGGLTDKARNGMDGAALVDATMLHELTHVFGTLDNADPGGKCYGWERVTDLAAYSDESYTRGGQDRGVESAWNSGESLMFFALGLQVQKNGMEIVDNDGVLKKAGS